MDVLLPELSYAELDLSPVVPARRGTPSVDVGSVISIGGPISVAVGVEDIPEGDEAQLFVAARSAQFSFSVLHFSCSVKSGQEDPLTKVALDFVLTRSDVTEGPAPIALSMTPQRLDRPVELSRTVKLGSNLKVIDAGVELAEKVVRFDIYVQALNQLRSNPSWELYRTPRNPIVGMQNFAMVVQAPLGPCEGTLGVTATIRHRRLGVIPYSAAHKDSSPVTFTLPG